MTRLATVSGDYGALIAGCLDRTETTREQRAAMSALATQASIALQRIRAERERDELEARIRLLDELTRVAVSNPEMSEVFDAIAERVGRLIEHDRLSIAIWPPGEEFLESYAVWASSEKRPFRPRIALRTSSAGQAALTGEPVLVPHALESEHELTRELATLSDLHSMMILPLKSRGRVVGVLSFGSHEPARYGEPELRVAEEVADHLAVIVEHAWLAREATELARLQERARLAHEIHDTIAQSLVGIILELDLAEHMLRTDPTSARHELQRARSAARQALDEARQSVLALRPAPLEERSLADAVRAELEGLSEDGLAVEVAVGEPSPAGTPDAEDALFRIAQEALANVRRHARARRVQARLWQADGVLSLTIEDDGSGFDPAAGRRVDTSGGFGLTSMRERAEEAGGELRVESAPGKGTRIEVRLPAFEAMAADAAVSADEPAAPAPPPATAGGTIRVLVADDHEFAREGVQQMLGRAPEIEVVAEAKNGAEALDLARQHRPDVVLTDLQMPELSGVELIAALREEGLAARAVVLSAYVDQAAVDAAKEAGAAGCLPKDVAQEQLVEAVRAAYRGEELPSLLLHEAGAPSAADQRPGDDLTPREQDVLRLVTTGLRNKEIALELAISVATVRFHVANLLSKLGVDNRTQAASHALERGLVDARPARGDRAP